MKEQSAAGILETTIEKVKNLVSVSTIIGDPMQIEGMTIIPVSKVAFLVISDGEVTLKHITAFDNAAERVVNLVPEMFDKVTSVVNKAKKEKARAAQDAADDALVSATMEELAKPEA